jgi:hypothetical protein
MRDRFVPRDLNDPFHAGGRPNSDLLRDAHNRSLYRGRTSRLAFWRRLIRSKKAMLVTSPMLKALTGARPTP